VLDTVRTPAKISGGRLAVNDCRKVEIYFEADYKLYQDWGSDISYITNRLSSIFNNVATLYANEGVKIELSGILVWDTPDPYAGAGSTTSALQSFKTRWNNMGNNFNGDIAHLISARNLGGGQASLTIRNVPVQNAYDLASVFDKPSGRNSAYGVSGNFSDTSTPLPSYSYEVYILAHELGHNFGLPHTHSCIWSGGPIDNCATTENGPCPAGPTPTNGGTIMSYCANLANGFGPQPSAKLKYEVLVADNLRNPGINPPTISPAAVTVVQGQSTTLTVSNCSGTVVWNDGITTGLSRTITPTSSYSYEASCSVSNCLSAPASAVVTVTCATPIACTVAAPSGLSPFFGISSFSLDAISTNNTFGSPANLGTNYEDLSCQQSALLAAGTTYAFSLTGTFNNSSYAKIYIDYNANGQFTDAGELVYSGGNANSHSGNITVPTSAVANTSLRMRVLFDPNSSSTSCNLAGTGNGSGKANDYAVTVTGTTCPPGLRETVQSGDWDDPAVWSCGTLPVASDLVKISAGHVVSLPSGYTADALSIELLGTLQYGANATVRLKQP
uniref:M12 family metallo-peptidase n=1 Tax=Persicitalea sp. TaxID=3100273 RepID=UPI003593FEDC